HRTRPQPGALAGTRVRRAHREQRALGDGTGAVARSALLTLAICADGGGLRRSFSSLLGVRAARQASGMRRASGLVVGVDRGAINLGAIPRMLVAQGDVGACVEGRRAATANRRA